MSTLFDMARDSDPTDREILDWIDPDWRARWRWDVDSAAAYYKRYAADRWLDAIEELR